MAARVISGSRKVLIYEGYKYQKNKVHGDRIHWRCWREECRAALCTNVINLDDDNPPVQVLRRSDHNHNADDDAISRNETLNMLHDNVREDPTVPIKMVFNSAVRRLNRQGGGDRAPVPELHTVRSAMTRARTQMMPEIPTEIQDVNIEGPWAESWSGERFHLHTDNDWDVVLYATAENLRLLRICEEVYMDGTFKTTPRPFQQFFLLY